MNSDTTNEIMERQDQALRRLIAVVLVLMLLIAAVLTSGCAAPKMFENRLMCTLDNSSAVIVSQWGGFGISSHLSDADARLICSQVPQQLQAPPARDTRSVAPLTL